jgi:hypothetical protein
MMMCQAQIIAEQTPKVFNWGAKIGFNSAMPIINSLSIDGVEMVSESVDHKVGLMASVFCRINVERFFIQPALSVHLTESEISFTIPQNDGILPSRSFKYNDEQFKLTTHSIDVPVLIGYNVVKEGPYMLSFMFGPKLKYNYRVNYTPNWEDAEHRYEDDSTPFEVGLSTGIGVTIWPLFLDFSYEFGLNKVQSDFTETYSDTPYENKIIMDKRTNILSFSLGVLF